ncbi:hypothetical protein I5U44_16170 [Stenotrophomonas maltophilia]|nr:hypothetical protein [Stenotrophomonas maltophilia]
MSAQDKYSLQERGRFKAWWDAARPLEGSAFPYEIAWAAWQAALPAQPSPGGQGDAREQFEEYRGGDCERDAQGYYVNARTAQDWAMWQAALAARQSVGEPVAEAIEQLADDVESCVSDACGYLASDSGWDDYGIYRDDAAARYRALPDRIRALAAAPAQVVDLGALVAELAEADREYSEAKKKYYTVSAKSSAAGGRAACSAAYQREVTAKARLDAAVRALIDSQAVGK